MRNMRRFSGFGDCPDPTDSNCPEYVNPYAPVDTSAPVDLSQAPTESDTGSGTATAIDLSTGQTSSDTTTPVDLSTAQSTSDTGAGTTAPSGPSWWETAGTTLINAAAKVAPGLISSASASQAAPTVARAPTASPAASGNFLTAPLIPGTPLSPLLLVGVGAGVLGLILILNRRR